jgi:hypothetical protein
LNTSKQATKPILLTLACVPALAAQAADNENAFDSFVNYGWQFGGQSTVAAKSGDKGGSIAGAVSVLDGVWMYQLTDKGLAADISAGGTKYYKTMRSIKGPSDWPEGF